MRRTRKYWASDQVNFEQTPDRPGARQRALPTFYYHRHFLELLDFIDTHYRHVLMPEHEALNASFRRLDVAAQRLYVRLANRKGRLFDVARLRYPEIPGLEGALRALRAGAWIGPPSSRLFEDVLSFLTKREIRAALGPWLPGLSPSLKKPELVELALARCEPGEFMSRTRLDRLDRLLVQRRAGWVAYLLFLYFGESRESLSRFTLRDMGLVRTHSFREIYEPRFSDREEALQTFFFARRLRRYRRGDQRVRRLLAAEAGDWPEPAYDGAAALRDTLAHAIGRDLERAGLPGEALAHYRRGDSVACTEREIRLLLADGDREAAQSRLETCLDQPRSPEERLFAEDLYRQKFGCKRTSALTDALRSAETIELDEALSGSPERGAIAHYVERGWRAWRAENGLWRTLFGLLFWDELFGRDHAGLHSPFEALPQPLRDGTFYAGHEEAIETRLAGLADTNAVKRRLLRTSTRHFGTPNGIFRWRRSMAETMFALLDHADGAAVAAVLRRLAREYRQARYGFPDLLVIDDLGARFVEIKAEGDQLRRNQLVQLQQLRAAGLRADVVRVRWVLDPNQTYVVIDVETTGGQGERHRITELAAVKVRDGRIVDRFESLINPQRTIPRGITRLTGITDEMVADAPRFADLADDFEAFMGDAIFVAHNVNFDYGFLSREYARLGRSFRHPKLCTCASMRKLYPGGDSYSLAALCQRFDIALETHHRALCDAEAAAQLLLIVNEKRAEALGRG
jgi:DNA polymerase-3 subunit epsilon